MLAGTACSLFCDEEDDDDNDDDDDEGSNDDDGSSPTPVESFLSLGAGVLLGEGVGEA